MGFRSFRFQKKTFYHIYNRGCNKQRLFFCEEDFLRFSKVIQRYLYDYPFIKIHVWSFLPNHFHFLISEKETGLEKKEEKDKTGLCGSSIPDFMRKIQVSYAMYFNSKYKELVKQGKKSPVFEGRFKAKEIIGEDYLAQVAYYIRHNALKHGIVDNVRDWEWAGATESSDFPAMEYVGLASEFDPGFE